MPTYTIQGDREVRYGGPCVVCDDFVNPTRHWEAVLLYQRPLRGESKGRYRCAHLGCVGGRRGGVQGRYRGPEKVVVD